MLLTQEQIIADYIQKRDAVIKDIIDYNFAHDNDEDKVEKITKHIKKMSEKLAKLETEFLKVYKPINY